MNFKGGIILGNLDTVATDKAQLMDLYRVRQNDLTHL